MHEPKDDQLYKSQYRGRGGPSLMMDTYRSYINKQDRINALNMYIQKSSCNTQMVHDEEEEEDEGENETLCDKICRILGHIFPDVSPAFWFFIHFVMDVIIICISLSSLSDATIKKESTIHQQKQNFIVGGIYSGFIILGFNISSFIVLMIFHAVVQKILLERIMQPSALCAAFYNTVDPELLYLFWSAIQHVYWRSILFKFGEGKETFYLIRILNYSDSENPFVFLENVHWLITFPTLMYIIFAARLLLLSIISFIFELGFLMNAHDLLGKYLRKYGILRRFNIQWFMFAVEKQESIRNMFAYELYQDEKLIRQLETDDISNKLVQERAELLLFKNAPRNCTCCKITLKKNRRNTMKLLLPPIFEEKNIIKSESSTIKNWLACHYVVNTPPLLFLLSNSIALTNKTSVKNGSDIFFKQILMSLKLHNRDKNDTLVFTDTPGINHIPMDALHHNYHSPPAPASPIYHDLHTSGVSPQTHVSQCPPKATQGQAMTPTDLEKLVYEDSYQNPTAETKKLHLENIFNDIDQDLKLEKRHEKENGSGNNVKEKEYNKSKTVKHKPKKKEHSRSVSNHTKTKGKTEKNVTSKQIFLNNIKTEENNAQEGDKQSKLLKPSISKKGKGKESVDANSTESKKKESDADNSNNSLENFNKNAKKDKNRFMDPDEKGSDKVRKTTSSIMYTTATEKNKRKHSPEKNVDSENLKEEFQKKDISKSEKDSSALKSNLKKNELVVPVENDTANITMVIPTINEEQLPYNKKVTIDENILKKEEEMDKMLKDQMNPSIVRQLESPQYDPLVDGKKDMSTVNLHDDKDVITFKSALNVSSEEMRRYDRLEKYNSLPFNIKDMTIDDVIKKEYDSETKFQKEKTSNSSSYEQKNIKNKEELEKVEASCEEKLGKEKQFRNDDIVGKPREEKHETTQDSHNDAQTEIEREREREQEKKFEKDKNMISGIKGESIRDLNRTSIFDKKGKTKNRTSLLGFSRNMGRGKTKVSAQKNNAYIYQSHLVNEEMNMLERSDAVNMKKVRDSRRARLSRCFCRKNYKKNPHMSTFKKDISLEIDDPFIMNIRNPMSLNISGNEFITRENIEVFLKPEEAEEFMKEFDLSGHGKIDFIMFQNAIKRVITCRKKFIKSLKGQESILRLVRTLMSILMSFLSAVVILFIFGVSPDTIIVTGAAFITAITVILSYMYTSFITSVIFIAFSNPYNIGDRIRLDGGEAMYIKKIKTYTTEFETTTGKIVIYENSKLSNAKIFNESRSKNAYIDISFKVDINTPLIALKELRKSLQFLVDSRPSDFCKTKNLYFGYSLQPGHYYEISFWIKCVEGWGNWRKVFELRTDIYDFIILQLRLLSISYRLPTQKIGFTAPLNIIDNGMNPPAGCSNTVWKGNNKNTKGPGPEQVEKEGRNPLFIASSKHKKELPEWFPSKEKRMGYSMLKDECYDMNEHMPFEDYLRQVEQKEVCNYYYDEDEMKPGDLFEGGASILEGTEQSKDSDDYIIRQRHVLHKNQLYHRMTKKCIDKERMWKQQKSSLTIDREQDKDNYNGAKIQSSLFALSREQEYSSYNEDSSSDASIKYTKHFSILDKNKLGTVHYR